MDKIHLNPEQQLAFQKSLKPEKKYSARVVSLLGASLFICLTFINYFALPANEFARVLPTTLITLLIITTFFFSSFKQCFFKYYSQIGMTTFLAVGSTVCLMIALCSPGKYAHNVYYLTLLLLIVTIFSWSYMHRRSSITVTAILVTSFTAIKVFIHDAWNTEPYVLIMSLFFLIASASIVAMAQILRDKYIFKNYLLQQQLEINLDKKAKEAKHQKQLANSDALTGLPNRRFIAKTLAKSMLLAQQKNLNLVIMFLDLNGFKAINDTYGHDAGDEILTTISDRLKSCIRKDDQLARIGGDEFLIGLLVKRTETHIIDTIRKKIRSNIVEPVEFNEHQLKVGTSIGTALYPKDGKNIEDLIKIADENMYADKVRIKGLQK